MHLGEDARGTHSCLLIFNEINKDTICKLFKSYRSNLNYHILQKCNQKPKFMFVACFQHSKSKKLLNSSWYKNQSHQKQIEN